MSVCSLRNAYKIVWAFPLISIVFVIFLSMISCKVLNCCWFVMYQGALNALFIATFIVVSRISLCIQVQYFANVYYCKYDPHFD